MPASTTTRNPSPPASQPISGDIVTALEAQLAALRAERDTLQERLDHLTTTKAAAALQLPFDAMPKNYHENIILNINCRINTPQRLALRALFQGLYRTHATTADGRHIDLPVHAVQWLLENLAFTGVKP